MEELAGRGFTEQFTVVSDRLRGVGSKELFDPEQVSIREYHRFEGVSDPDDMAVLYAIQTRSGVRGTLVDAFGVYADPRVGDVLRRVPPAPATTAASAERD